MFYIPHQQDCIILGPPSYFIAEVSGAKGVSTVLKKKRNFPRQNMSSSFFLCHEAKTFLHQNSIQDTMVPKINCPLMGGFIHSFFFLSTLRQKYVPPGQKRIAHKKHRPAPCDDRCLNYLDLPAQRSKNHPELPPNPSKQGLS